MVGLVILQMILMSSHLLCVSPSWNPVCWTNPAPTPEQSADRRPESSVVKSFCLVSDFEDCEC